ncbi:fg-gap repeat domain-containing protein [Fusarium napiforme]|uniref:Fg-gap repeat domain-containing protein n=1 Tax=Fusarium napiforme TaxID=42672 RepID=A0A8H5NJ38_9HYPO|nr:fg-gap repeat domain-containing protein [Fusarium napiforme]
MGKSRQNSTTTVDREKDEIQKAMGHEKAEFEALEVARHGGREIDDLIDDMERQLDESGGLKKGFFQVQFANPKHFTWLLVAFASMGGLLSGLDQSLISGANLFLPDDLGLTDHENSLVNSGMPLGAVGGALLLSPANEYFGRKGAIIISIILYTIGAALEAGSINFGMIVSSRVILGLGVGLEGGTVPVYVAETVERRIRGNLVSLYQFNIALGDFNYFAPPLTYQPDANSYRPLSVQSLGFAVHAYVTTPKPNVTAPKQQLTPRTPLPNAPRPKGHITPKTPKTPKGRATNSESIGVTPLRQLKITSSFPEKPGQGKSVGQQTQKGDAGENNGIYKHKSEEMSVKTTIKSSNGLNQYRFAKLFDRESDELVGWYEQRSGNHAFGAWKINGDGSFTKIDDMNLDLSCKPAGINFIDMNGDGYDNLVCIGPDGNAQLSVSQGDGDKSGSKRPTFKLHGEIKKNEGFEQDRVRLADIDGDGRGDYCIIDDGGKIQCWRNGGTSEAPEYWKALGTRFTAKNMSDSNGVRFADNNGDGRDDWLWVSDVGETTTYTNGRSCAKGKEGDGLNIYWRQGFYDGKTSGPTHPGMGKFGSEGLRNRIVFAPNYDKPETRHEESDGEHTLTIRTWKNIGGGGTELNADGNRYCNMWGHGDEKGDFIWIAPDGTMRGWKNWSGKVLLGGNTYWQAEERDIWVPRDYGKTIHVRRNIYLADWDGGGTCDVILVDPSQKFKVVDVWLNERPYKEGWNWNHQWNPESANDVRCKNQKNGLGIHDLAVQIADLTNNGRSDYLCMAGDGTTNAWIHNDENSLTDAQQIQKPEGPDRANLRWHDVNGDGKADMIWVDKFNGNAKVYYNEGQGDNSGSSFKWNEPSEALREALLGLASISLIWTER